MASVAELEAGLISARTNATLAAAKARGVKLGGDRGVVPTNDVHAKTTAAIQKDAKDAAADLETTIRRLQADGVTSLRDIASGLNTFGITTRRGGSWQAVQVSRVLSRISAS